MYTDEQGCKRICRIIKRLLYYKCFFICWLYCKSNYFVETFFWRLTISIWFCSNLSDFIDIITYKKQMHACYFRDDLLLRYLSLVNVSINKSLANISFVNNYEENADTFNPLISKIVTMVLFGLALKPLLNLRACLLSRINQIIIRWRASGSGFLGGCNSHFHLL